MTADMKGRAVLTLLVLMGVGWAAVWLPLGLIIPASVGLAWAMFARPVAPTPNQPARHMGGTAPDPDESATRARVRLGIDEGDET